MTINSNRWINALPNAKSKLIEENHNLNSDIWIKTLSGPKQKNNNTIKKYSAVSVFFIIGLILVSVIKNEARNLQKEINNLRTSISEIKLKDYDFKIIRHRNKDAFFQRIFKNFKRN